MNNKIEKLKLIEGKFTEDDAREILLKLFSDKINFHRLKNFSSQIRHGNEDEIANSRIPELQESITKINSFLDKHKSENRKLHITSEITISIVD